MTNNQVTLTDPTGRSPTSQVLAEPDAPQPEPGPDPGLYFAKKGKQNIRDTGLTGVPLEEIMRRARDKTLSREERQRYIREEKARKLRSIEKRSNFEVGINVDLGPAFT